MRKLFATLFLTCALAVGATAPMAGAAPIVTGGLVNITIVDVLNNNEVTLDRVVNVAAAINIAANVCDTSVAVLAAEFNDTGGVDCQSLIDGGTAVISQP
jgi:hypothetical protein